MAVYPPADRTFPGAFPRAECTPLRNQRWGYKIFLNPGYCLLNLRRHTGAVMIVFTVGVVDVKRQSLVSFAYRKKWAALRALLEKVELNAEQWTPFVDPGQQQIAGDHCTASPVSSALFRRIAEAERVDRSRPLSLPGRIEGSSWLPFCEATIEVLTQGFWGR